MPPRPAPALAGILALLLIPALAPSLHGDDPLDPSLAAPQDPRPADSAPSDDSAPASDDSPPPTIPVETTVVTATRLSLDPFDQPYAYYPHDREELDQAVGRTALDRIDHGPGVIIQRTAPGQTSPYIRGLTGKQSLLLFDGVRLSHATMRSGPNQYSALIPDMSIDRIDVILGSSGVVTGSDGLTGAIDLRLPEAGRGVDKTLSSWTTTRVDSANGAQLATGIDGRSGVWSYSLEGSLIDFHDRVGGKDMDRNLFGPGADSSGSIPNTAYDEGSWAGRLSWEGLPDQRLELAFGHTRQDDARRPDGYFENSGESRRISRFYDPQTFSYTHLRHTWTPRGGLLDELVTTAWWHRHDEAQTREDLTNGGADYRRREYDDRIDSTGIETQATRRLDDHEITFGVLALFERTGNQYREFRDIGSTDGGGATPYQPENWDAGTTITDGARYDTTSIYAQDLWWLDEKWSLLSGLRYTIVDWEFDVADNDADDLTGSLRGSWQFREDMMAFVGVAKAFRAPNLNDLDGATDSGSSGTPAFGNPDLDPEVSNTVELGWRWARGRDELLASAFLTRIDDLIQRVYPAGEGPGTLENARSAELRGFELLWDIGLPTPPGLGERLAVFGALSGVDSETEVPQPDGSILEEPISRANRLYGLAGLKLDLDRQWWARAQVRFHDAYGRGDVTLADANNVRLTVPGRGDGTIPGFGVVDLSAGWRDPTGDRWITLTLENLGDKTYRALGSGADAPGFNIVLAAGVRF